MEHKNNNLGNFSPFQCNLPLLCRLYFNRLTPGDLLGETQDGWADKWRCYRMGGRNEKTRFILHVFINVFVE